MGIVIPETCWAVSLRQSNKILPLIVASSWVFYLSDWRCTEPQTLNNAISRFYIPLYTKSGKSVQLVTNTGYFPPFYLLYFFFSSFCPATVFLSPLNPLNAELNPICHLLALLGAHPIFHVSRIRINYTLPSIFSSVLPQYLRFFTLFFIHFLSFTCFHTGPGTNPTSYPT